MEGLLRKDSLAASRTGFPATHIPDTAGAAPIERCIAGIVAVVAAHQDKIGECHCQLEPLPPNTPLTSVNRTDSEAAVRMGFVRKHPDAAAAEPVETRRGTRTAAASVVAMVVAVVLQGRHPSC